MFNLFSKKKKLTPLVVQFWPQHQEAEIFYSAASDFVLAGTSNPSEMLPPPQK